MSPWRALHRDASCAIFKLFKSIIPLSDLWETELPTTRGCRGGSNCPGTSRRGCRCALTKPSSSSHRKQPQKEVQGREKWWWEEKRDRDISALTAARQGTGTRVRPDASRHATGAAAAPAQADDGLTGLSEAVRRLPGSTHAGAGVPMTAADDRRERSHPCTTSTTLLAPRAGWTYTAVKKQQQSPHGTNSGSQGLRSHQSYGDCSINLFRSAQVPPGNWKH